MNEFVETTEFLIQLCIDLKALSEETLTHLESRKASEVVRGVGEAWQQAADVLTTQAAYQSELIDVPAGASLAGGFAVLMTKIRTTLSTDEQHAALDRFENANVDALQKFDKMLDDLSLPNSRGIVMIHHNKIDHLASEIEKLLD